MSIRRLLAAAVVLLAVAGCSSSPTKPVITVPLSSLVLTPHADTVAVGAAHAFTVVARDTAGVVVANPTLTWSSGNVAVFRVSGTGFVTGVGEGTARLYVRSGGRVDSATVLVLPLQRGWFLQTTNLSTDLNGVCFLPDGNTGWAVGATGRIVRTSNAGSAWAMQTSPVSNVLNAVWFTSATEGWVAGDAGRILHTLNGGALWSIMASGTTDNLNGIVFATRDTGWAVGANGTILRTFDRGVTWTRKSVTSFTLHAVSFSGTRDGWAVGDNGTIVGTHDRGVSWYLVQPAVTSQPLYGVRRLSTVFAQAVGDGGATPRTAATPDSEAWANGNVGAANDLRAVHFADAAHGWACGRNGAGLILVTGDGGDTWTPQVANDPFVLNGIWFVDANRGWAVGAKGNVVHTVTGGAP